MTAELSNSSATDVLRIKPGLWTVSESIKVPARVIFEGGVLLPTSGSVIEFEQDIETTTKSQLFDLRNVRWSKGLRRDSSRKRGSYIWETTGGVRLPSLAKASWFGAKEEAGHDNTLALQAMLDSEANVAVLDGFFEHTANWVASGQTLRGEIMEDGSGRSGLKTLVHDRSFADLLANTDPATPAEQAFRGLSTRSGAHDVIFSDFEFDGSASEHFDHRDGYRNYLSGDEEIDRGDKAFRRHLLRQGGIFIGQMEDDKGFRSPTSTLIERVDIRNTVRSSIVANRAPKVTIRDCRLSDSDTDHLVYADRNPDLLVENTELSGFAHGAMVVISCGTIRNCRAVGLAPNPTPRLDTQSVLWLRNDLNQPSTVEGLEVSGDLSALAKGDKTSRIIRITGERSAYFGDISVRHEGAGYANTSVFGADFSCSRIGIEGVTAASMPEGALLWKSEKRVSDLSIRNSSWEFRDSSTKAYSLMQFGALKNVDFADMRLMNGEVDALVEVSRAARQVSFTGIEGGTRIGTLIEDRLGSLN